MIASVAGLDCFQLWFFLDYCRNQIVKCKVSTTTIKSTNESITYQLQQELTTNSMTPRDISEAPRQDSLGTTCPLALSIVIMVVVVIVTIIHIMSTIITFYHDDDWLSLSLSCSLCHHHSHRYSCDISKTWSYHSELWLVRWCFTRVPSLIHLKLLLLPLPLMQSPSDSPQSTSRWSFINV